MKLVGNTEKLRESTEKMDVISTRRLKEVSQTVNCINSSLLTERNRELIPYTRYFEAYRYDAIY